MMPLPWQAKSLQLRTHVDLLLAVGGRGGGKSHCARLHLLAHCNDLGQHAAPVVVREAYAPLHEFLAQFYEMAYSAFGSKTRYNQGDSAIHLPTGGTVFGASLHEGERGYVRWQGRNLTGIWGEELSNFTSVQFSMMRRLESNLRPPLGFKPERFWTGNPGGVGSSIVFRNWLSKAPPWRAARDHHGLSYVWMPSVYSDNTHIDAKLYRRNLIASVGADQALADAWLAGDWSSIGGLMFPLNPEVHVIDPFPVWMAKRVGKPFAASDWGNGAPATCGLAVQLKEPVNWHGTRLPYGSVVLLEETDTAIDEYDLSMGSGLDARSFAAQCKDMFTRWEMPNVPVVVDDAKGLGGDSVIDYFRSENLNASKPDKVSRVDGWNIIRTYLAEAEKKQGRPGLYLSTRCPHTINTLSEAPRGTLNPRDLDPKWDRDHWVDMLSYLMKEVSGTRGGSGRVIGMW